MSSEFGDVMEIKMPPPRKNGKVVRTNKLRVTVDKSVAGNRIDDKVIESGITVTTPDIDTSKKDYTFLISPFF